MKILRILALTSSIGVAFYGSLVNAKSLKESESDCLYQTPLYSLSFSTASMLGAHERLTAQEFADAHNFRIDENLDSDNNLISWEVASMVGAYKRLTAQELVDRFKLTAFEEKKEQPQFT